MTHNRSFPQLNYNQIERHTTKYDKGFNPTNDWMVASQMIKREFGQGEAPLLAAEKRTKRSRSNGVKNSDGPRAGRDKSTKMKYEEINEINDKTNETDEINVKKEPSVKDEFENLRPIDHIKIEIEEPPNVFVKVSQDEMTSNAPNNWIDIYNQVVAMRSKFMAPVDTQGCERMPNTINKGVRTTNPRVYRFQLLISLMLSSQTKDEVNFDAMYKFHNGLLAKNPDGLCLEAVLELSEAEIDHFICKVGFHNRKSVYIKKSCELLRDNFGGDIPQTIEEIVTLPGVGPKMGYLLLQSGWNINSGIGVDVHLHRLAQLWGWTSKKAKTPEHTRLELESWLPHKYWSDLNPLLVGFGQAICVPRASNCDICYLARSGSCKASNKKLMKPLDDQRIAKLSKQRADLSRLLHEFL